MQSSHEDTTLAFYFTLFLFSAIVIGDFNVNMLKNKDLQEAASVYGFFPAVNLATTINGSLLDQSFINFEIDHDDLNVEILPSYFSDHHLIILCLRKLSIS